MPEFTGFTPTVGEFLDTTVLATATTLNRDGSPQLTYVFFMRDGDQLSFSTTADRVKTKNLKRDQRTNFAVVDPANPYKWVIINGTATVTDEGAFEWLERSVGRRMPADQVKAAVDRMRSEPRVVVTVTPQSIRTTGLD